MREHGVVDAKVSRTRGVNTDQLLRRGLRDGAIDQRKCKQDCTKAAEYKVHGISRKKFV